MSYAYSGNLISNLTRPKEKEYPHSVLELIERFPEMFYVTLKGGIGEEIIMVFRENYFPSYKIMIIKYMRRVHRPVS